MMAGLAWIIALSCFFIGITKSTSVSSTEGQFDGNAYAEYLLHKTPVKSASNDVTLSFKTIQPNGLILHGDSRGDEFGDYFTLELIGGKLRFALSLGRYQGIDDMRSVALGDDLTDNRFHTVEVQFRGRETWVFLDRHSTGEKHRRIETLYKELHLDDFFFIGGAHDFSGLRDIISGANFKGCLKGVSFNNWNLLQALGGDATLLRKYGVKDQCKVESYMPFTMNGSPSEINFGGISTSGNSLEGSLLFRTYKKAGIIIQQPLSNDRGFELGYTSEKVYLTVTIKNSHTTASVRQIFKYRAVDKGMWHTVKFEINAARVSLTVNNINDLRPPGSDFPSNFFTGNVVVGGKDFIGCLWNLTLNDIQYDVTTNNNANIQVGVCNITDFCFPNSCKNGGKCSQDGKTFACDCYGTDYKGAVCQLSKYFRSCYEIRQDFPEMETGMFTIDPDGTGPQPPYQVQCNITTEHDWFGDEISRVWTEVKSLDHNVLLQKWPPQEASKPESVVRDVFYQPNFQSARTVALASEYCRQFVEYLCTNSKLLNKLKPSYGHWVGSHGRHNYYWGGSGPDHPGKCACGVRGDCIGGGNYWCNCDATRDTLESDEGYLMGTNGQTVPVSQVWFGDVNIDQDHYANYTIGSLLCYGRPNNTATFTREDGIISFRSREGTLLGDNGYISLYFRTPYNRGILFHQGDKTKNTRDFIRVAITGNNSVTLSFDIGNGVQTLTVNVSENVLNTNRLWHRVDAWFNIKEFVLQVDNVQKKILNPLLSSKQLDVVGMLHIGGYMRDLMQGFVGCMRGLMINGRMINLAKFGAYFNYVNPGYKGACLGENKCKGGARCIDDYNIYRCDCRLTPYYGYHCEKDYGAAFREKQSYLKYSWPEVQKDAVGTDIAVGFETKQCSGTVMRMNGEDPRDYFSISIDTNNHLRFAFSFSHPGSKQEEDALMIDSDLAEGKSFCNGKKHSFSIEHMFDKVVFKVDGGQEIRRDVPKLSVRFKKPKEVVIGSTGRGRFEGCISGVKVTNWPTRKVKEETVEPIKWSLYDFTHEKDMESVGIAREKCGPEPDAPPIPTIPVPGPQGPIPPTPPTPEDNKKCSSSPCQNGGTCVDGKETYQCKCPFVFSGKHCENDISDKVKIFKLKATVDRKWNMNYGNPQTNEYKELKNQLERSLESELAKLPDFLLVQIISFTEGSVKVEFIVYFKASANISEESLIRKLETTQNSSLKGIKIESVAAKSKAKRNMSMATWFTALIITAVVMLSTYTYQ